MQTEPKTSWREILSVVLLRTLPLVAITAFLFRKARLELDVVASLPSVVYNTALLFTLLLILKYTAGSLLRRLASEGKDKDRPADG